MQHTDRWQEELEVENEAFDDATGQEPLWKWEVSQRRQRTQQFAHKQARTIARRRSFRRAQQRSTYRKNR